MTNDLISRSELKKVFGYTDEWYKGRTVCELIDNALTVEERPQGEWEYVGMSSLGLQIARCKKCNEKAYGMTDYCPNCGVKMKGGEK